MEERKVSEEMLAKVSGGALKEEDKDGIICWLRARKDFGESLESTLAQAKQDYLGKVDYYDLTDTEGKHVSLDVLLGYITEYWEEV